MPNITIAVEEKLIKESREYARKHRSTLNALIRKLLSDQVNNASNDWLDEVFQLMDRAKGNSRGKKWSRGDLYDV